MSIASFIISCVALLFAGFNFWFYDRKIKIQDVKINDYQIRKFELEDKEKKKALVKGNIVKEEKGKLILKVFNSGKANAYNVRLEFMSKMNNIIYSDNIFPYQKLLPQDGTSITMQMCIGCADTIEVKFMWDDDLQKDNENTQVLTLR